ncbi:sulfotransferase 1E1-like isoform X2 [Homarus americanus]|uniref:sulfotransferase 1E1-like isoform X2 n=1 Tax=Homarus americanus TaxID=6706 RepID=UPI001C48DD94|nr:sulfotransferase 1E1-like isoform X2 [Homarus americanus]
MSNQRLRSGHEVVPMSEEWLTRLEKDQKMYKQGMIRLMPDGWLYPTAFINFADRIYNFEFRSSDVVLMTMPKSGTTWMQEILWTMLHNPDLDHPQADEPIYHRAPEISLDMMFDSKGMEGAKIDNFARAFIETCPGRKPEDGMSLQMCELTADPRVIKTHLPLSVLAPDLLDKAKVVYVARNPKDVVVSYYYYYCMMKAFTYTGSFTNFVKYFMNDEVFGPYWPHLRLAWEKKDHPNMFFVFYEDMKEDIMAVLHKLNKFLGTNLTQQQLDNVSRHTSFSAMKSRGEPLIDGDVFNADVREKVGGYFRKGIIGDWKNHFTPELEQEMNQWVESHVPDIGITFK